MLDAPKTSHLLALDADDSDGGEYARTRTPTSTWTRTSGGRAARQEEDAPKKSRERKAPTNAEEAEPRGGAARRGAASAS